LNFKKNTKILIYYSGPVPVMEEITKVQPEPKQRTGSTTSADELLLGDEEHGSLTGL
jgi:hypothetical protein